MLQLCFYAKYFVCSKHVLDLPAWTIGPTRNRASVFHNYMKIANDHLKVLIPHFSSYFTVFVTKLAQYDR